MNNHFAMDQNVIKQLTIISGLEKHSETTVQSLYAQAIIEYSLYHHEKDKLLKIIDRTLIDGHIEEFLKRSSEYKQLIDEHSDGKTVVENGFELYLTFE